MTWLGLLTVTLLALAGCPKPVAPAWDTDGDGITDSRDACPSEPETINGLHDDDGCPDSPDAPCVGFPSFPDPTPFPSSYKTMLLTDAAPDAPTLGDAQRVLAADLVDARYLNSTWFCYRDGFAVLTAAERIAEDGRPAPDLSRWAMYAPRPRTLMERLYDLVFDTPGRYRVFAFLASRAPVTFVGEEPTQEELRHLLEQGMAGLPAVIAGRGAADYLLTVLVFEFRQPDSEAPALVERPGRQTTNVHLQQAGFTGLAALAPR